MGDGSPGRATISGHYLTKQPTEKYWRYEDWESAIQQPENATGPVIIQKVSLCENQFPDLSS